MQYVMRNKKTGNMFPVDKNLLEQYPEKFATIQVDDDMQPVCGIQADEPEVTLPPAAPPIDPDLTEDDVLTGDSMDDDDE